MIAPPWVAPVYARMPEVSGVIDSPFAHGELAWGRRRRIARDVGARRYDEAIVLPNSLKSALVPWLARIPRRTGYVGEQRYVLLNDRRQLATRRHPRLVDRFAALAFPPNAAVPQPLPDPRLRVDAAARDAAVVRLALDPTRAAVALCPGAEYGPAKRWPATYYAEIARRQMADGRAVWIFGSGKDAPIGDEIARLAPGSSNLCGRTSLVEAIDLLAACSLVLTNDSGLMHIASAVGCNVVALFGSSTPDYTPPLSPTARVITLRLECSPCFARTCPLGHMNCLNQLKPAQVEDTIAALSDDPATIR